MLELQNGFQEVGMCTAVVDSRLCHTGPLCGQAVEIELFAVRCNTIMLKVHAGTSSKAWYVARGCCRLSVGTGRCLSVGTGAGNANITFGNGNNAARSRGMRCSGGTPVVP